MKPKQPRRARGNDTANGIELQEGEGTGSRLRQNQGLDFLGWMGIGLNVGWGQDVTEEIRFRVGKSSAPVGKKGCFSWGKRVTGWVYDRPPLLVCAGRVTLRLLKRKRCGLVAQTQQTKCLSLMGCHATDGGSDIFISVGT